MAISAGNDIDAADFITKSERNATPANDSGRVPQMEADGRVSEDHMESPGAIDIVIGEAFTGATTPQPAYISDSDGKAYLCDANDTTKMKFVGFVNTTGSTNDTERLIVSGLVRGFSGLTAGEKYYLSDTAGTISTTAGTNEVLVGIAVTSSVLLIQKGKRYANGVHSVGTTATSEDITLGFRPSRIRFFGSAASGDGHALVFATWSAQGGLDGISQAHSATNSRSVVEVRLHTGAGGSDNMTLDVTNVTDTGFTLSESETGTHTWTGSVIWEAEGEL